MNSPPLLTPHGPSFAFLDTCDVFAAEKRARGSKWLDPKSEFFKGHFPGKPMMPGVLLVECAAQAAGVLWQELAGLQTKTALLLAQILQFKFTHAALPDETVTIDVVLEKEMGPLAQFFATLKVAERAVGEGRFILSRPAAP